MSKKNREPQRSPLDPWTTTKMDLNEQNPLLPSERHLIGMKAHEVKLELATARVFRKRGLLTQEQLEIFEAGVQAALAIPGTRPIPFIEEDLMVEATAPYRQIIGQILGDFYGKH